MCFPESHRIRHPALCIGAVAGADAVRGILINDHLMGNVVSLQGPVKIPVLARHLGRAQHNIVFPPPEVHRRIVCVYHITQVCPVVTPAAGANVIQNVVKRLHHCQVHHRVTQQQCTGSFHLIGAIAPFLVCKDSCDLSAGRKAHQRIIFRLHTELPGMGRDKLYRIGKILNGRIVAHVDPGAVPQHEHGVALFMQLVGRGATLFHLGGHGAAIAGHHQCIFATRLLAREIIQLHTPQ